MSIIHDLVIEIVDLLPEDLEKSSMIDTPYKYSSQEYSIENCEKFGVPFLPQFIDIDTYIAGDRFRIQGYLIIRLTMFHDWTEDQLRYLINLINLPFGVEITEKQGFPCIEIWNG